MRTVSRFEVAPHPRSLDPRGNFIASDTQVPLEPVRTLVGLSVAVFAIRRLLLTTPSLYLMSSQRILHRRGGWLPKDHKVLHDWLEKRIDNVKAKRLMNDNGETPKEINRVIKEFQDLIESDANLYMGFHQMFEQVPTKPPYDLNSSKDGPQVKQAIMHQLQLLAYAHDNNRSETIR